LAILRLTRRIRDAYRDWDVPRRAAQLESRSDRQVEGEAVDHSKTVNTYYDLSSEIMRFGWNESLHFAPLKLGESLEDAIVRHQRVMIEKLRLREGMRVIDVGCGFGGPMRRVASEAGVRVVCFNNNEHQLEQARLRNIEAGLDHMAEYVKGNFMDMSSIEADSLDAGYAIESTCHAPDKQRAFAQIFRILKPGALFWGQEMCLTDEFDRGSERHREIKQALMREIALSHIATFGEVDRALENVGFEVVEAADLNVQDGPAEPWYRPMDGKGGVLLKPFRETAPGRRMLASGLKLAEAVRLLPKGSAAVTRLMERGADAYLAGGKSGIFTPLYCFLARKPS